MTRIIIYLCLNCQSLPLLLSQGCVVVLSHDAHLIILADCAITQRLG